MPELIPDHSRIEQLLYYMNMMAGRGYNGSFIVWMYGGRISRNTFRKLKHQLSLSGIPIDDTTDEEEPAHAAQSEAQG